MLCIKDLCKYYGQKKVVHNVTAKFAAQVNVIVGLNGSGKSTLLQLLGGFLPPTSGHIRLNGEDLYHLDAEDRHIGYVPQHACLFPHLTVRENVAYALRNKRGSLEHVKEAMELLEVEEYAHYFPHQLSGGFQSRVALARSLASNPKALFMDEPLSDVDQAVKEKLIPRFNKVLRSRGIPILYVTHDIHEASQMGQHFYVLSRGHLEKVSSAEEAFSHIRHDLLRYA